MGWRCRIRLIAPITHMVASTKKMIRGAFILVALPEDGCGSEHDISERDGQEQLPTEGHELVVAETGKRAAHPDVDEEEDENLGEQPEGTLNECVHRREEQEREAERGDDHSHGRQNELAENGFV